MRVRVRKRVFEYVCMCLSVCVCVYMFVCMWLHRCVCGLCKKTEQDALRGWEGRKRESPLSKVLEVRPRGARLVGVEC